MTHFRPTRFATFCDRSGIALSATLLRLSGARESPAHFYIGESAVEVEMALRQASTPVCDSTRPRQTRNAHSVT